MKRFVYSMTVDDKITVYTTCTHAQAFRFLNEKLKDIYGFMIDENYPHYIIKKGEPRNGNRSKERFSKDREL